MKEGEHWFMTCGPPRACRHELVVMSLSARPPKGRVAVLRGQEERSVKQLLWRWEGADGAPVPNEPGERWERRGPKLVPVPD